MSKLLKVVLLLAAACFGLLVVLGVIGYFWVKSRQADWKRDAVRIRAEAESFAKRHSAMDCVDESAKRLESCSGLYCEVQSKGFLEHCLAKVEKVESDFCSGVPKTSEILASVTWRLDRCKDLGMEDDQGCSRLLEEWQDRCKHP